MKIYYFLSAINLFLAVAATPIDVQTKLEMLAEFKKLIGLEEENEIMDLKKLHEDYVYEEEMEKINEKNKYHDLFYEQYMT